MRITISQYLIIKINIYFKETLLKSLVNTTNALHSIYSFLSKIFWVFIIITLLTVRFANLESIIHFFGITDCGSNGMDVQNFRSFDDLLRLPCCYLVVCFVVSAILSVILFAIMVYVRSVLISWKQLTMVQFIFRCSSVKNLMIGFMICVFFLLIEALYLR